MFYKYTGIIEALTFQVSNTSDPSRGHTGPTAGLSRGVDSYHGYAPHGSSPFSFQHVSSGRAYVGNLPARDYPQSKVLLKQFSSINSLPIVILSDFCSAFKQ